MREHGSAADRGSADAYYGRPCNPHKYPEGTYRGERVALTDPHSVEYKQYVSAYYNETDRKVW
jgi:hypothetical protein